MSTDEGRWRARARRWRRLLPVTAGDDLSDGTPPPLILRAGTALAIALVSGALTAALPHAITVGGVPVGDIGPPLVGLQHALAGESPYGVRLSARSLVHYPATTMVALLPFRAVPIGAAPVLFCALSSGLLAWACLAGGRWWRLLLFLSVPYLTALYSVQWSPLFAASLMLPPLLSLAVVKPQLGLALLAAGRWRRSSILGAGALIVASLVLRPTWPLEWWRSGAPGLYEARIPLLVLPGFVLVLSGFFLGSRRGRLLAAMSLIPQRFFYDQLLLFLVPANLRQMLVLLVSSWLGAWWCLERGLWQPASGAQNPAVWTVVVVSIYLPALAVLVGARWGPWRVGGDGEPGERSAEGEGEDCQAASEATAGGPPRVGDRSGSGREG